MPTSISRLCSAVFCAPLNQSAFGTRGCYLRILLLEFVGPRQHVVTSSLGKEQLESSQEVTSMTPYLVDLAVFGYRFIFWFLGEIFI